MCERRHRWRRQSPKHKSVLTAPQLKKEAAAAQSVDTVWLSVCFGAWRPTAAAVLATFFTSLTFAVDVVVVIPFGGHKKSPRAAKNSK